MLHLVRHGPPLIDPDRANATWALDPASTTNVQALGAAVAFPVHAAWFSSPEPKAYGTARLLTGAAIEVVDEFAEMRRPPGPWLGQQEWKLLVHGAMTAVDTPAEPGWETGRSTAERVVRALRRLWHRDPDQDLVLVGHGTAWTLLVARLTGEAVDLAGWDTMRMPDHCALELDRDGARMASAWGAWEP